MTQEEFYNKIEEWISKPRDGWNHITLMAYFCYKYEQSNNIKFRLVRWKSDPGKGKESRDFAKLFLIFAPEDYKDRPAVEKKDIRADLNEKIVNYINWMFDYKFRSGDKSVTGSGIFLLPSMINEFERMYGSFLIKKKSKTKIQNLISWCKYNVPGLLLNHQLEDIDDLRMIESYNATNPSSGDEITLINKARDMGLL